MLRQSFARLATEMYPNIIMNSCSSEGGFKCKTCLQLDEAYNRAKKTVRKMKILHCMRVHTHRFKRARRHYEVTVARSLADPMTHLSVIVDGMDQQKCMTPRGAGGSEFDKSWKTKLHVVGCIAHGRFMLPLVFLSEKWENCKSDIVVTTLIEAFKKVVASEGCLPDVLHVQLDNTSGENKNHNILGFLTALTVWGIFKDVYLNFAVVGHTHLDIDQGFSRFAVALRNGHRSLEEFFQRISEGCTVFGHPATAVLQDEVTNWSSAFKPMIRQELANITAPLHFRFEDGCMFSKAHAEVAQWAHIDKAWVEIPNLCQTNVCSALALDAASALQTKLGLMLAAKILNKFQKASWEALIGAQELATLSCCKECLDLKTKKASTKKFAYQTCDKKSSCATNEMKHNAREQAKLAEDNLAKHVDECEWQSSSQNESPTFAWLKSYPGVKKAHEAHLELERCGRSITDSGSDSSDLDGLEEFENDSGDDCIVETKTERSKRLNLSKKTLAAVQEHKNLKVKKKGYYTTEIEGTEGEGNTWELVQANGEGTQGGLQGWHVSPMAKVKADSLTTWLPYNSPNITFVETSALLVCAELKATRPAGLIKKFKEVNEKTHLLMRELCRRQSQHEKRSTDTYTVDKVLNSRRGKRNRMEYEIKWVGFTEAESSWEPRKNVTQFTIEYDTVHKRPKLNPVEVGEMVKIHGGVRLAGVHTFGRSGRVTMQHARSLLSGKNVTGTAVDWFLHELSNNYQVCVFDTKVWQMGRNWKGCAKEGRNPEQYNVWLFPCAVNDSGLAASERQALRGMAVHVVFTMYGECHTFVIGEHSDTIQNSLKTMIENEIDEEIVIIDTVSTMDQQQALFWFLRETCDLLANDVIHLEKTIQQLMQTKVTASIKLNDNVMREELLEKLMNARVPTLKTDAVLQSETYIVTEKTEFNGAVWVLLRNENQIEFWSLLREIENRWIRIEATD